MTVDTLPSAAPASRRLPSAWPRYAGWAWLLLTILFNNLGNLLMKAASHDQAGGIALYLTLPFIAGAGLFGLGMIAYTRALAYLRLSVAYPVLVGASIVLVSLVGIGLFGEPVTLRHAAGLVLVFAGLIVLTRDR